MIKTINIDEDTEKMLEEIRLHKIKTIKLNEKELNDSLLIRMIIREHYQQIKK